MDTVPKFVQLIKLVQQEIGMGHERVRAPRLVLAGAERKAALATLHAALATRPKLHPVSIRCQSSLLTQRPAGGKFGPSSVSPHY
jgi:hypothetical protein